MDWGECFMIAEAGGKAEIVIFSQFHFVKRRPFKITI